MSKKKSRKTTEELIAELRLFNHSEAAERLVFLTRENDSLRASPTPTEFWQSVPRDQLVGLLKARPGLFKWVYHKTPDGTMHGYGCDCAGDEWEVIDPVSGQWLNYARDDEDKARLHAEFLAAGCIEITETK